MPLILMYHRIADVPVDPWGLAVTPARFREHLEVLRRTRHPVPLTKFVRQLMEGTLHQHAVAVTFDDGYADNLLGAKPCLEAADVPATVFITTGYLDRPGEFWWDELARLILLEDGPQNLELSIRGRTLRIELGAEPPMRDASPWAASSTPLTGRPAAYLGILNTLRRLEDEERQMSMRELRSYFSGPSCAGAGRAMTSHEAGELVTDGLVTIGAHTVTHPILTEVGATVCHREIAESKAVCEELVGTNVTAFAYPYGKVDNEVRAAVGAAGFTSGFGTTEVPATSASDILALPRIQVFDWNGDAFERVLRSVSASGHPGGVS
jgi:peptidoglycan/xylan/chitin deacetylase (PgdA/CDA1 family)